MADQKQPPPSPAPKTVKARVVSNYGNAQPGAIVTVEEREYNRLRVFADGAFCFPVLITQADADAVATRKQATDAKAVAARAAEDLERSTSDGWADYQQKASSIVAAQRVAEQKRQHALLTGEKEEDPAVTAAAVAQRFADNVSAGRGA